MKHHARNASIIAGMEGGAHSKGGSHGDEQALWQLGKVLAQSGLKLWRGLDAVKGCPAHCCLSGPPLMHLTSDACLQHALGGCTALRCLLLGATCRSPFVQHAMQRSHMLSRLARHGQELLLQSQSMPLCKHHGLCPDAYFS